MVIATIWLLGAVLVGWAAAQRSRGPVGWFLIATVLSPLIGVLLLIVVPPVHLAEREERHQRNRILLVMFAAILGVVAFIDLATLVVPMHVVGVVVVSCLLLLSAVLLFPRRAGNLLGMLFKHHGEKTA
jgi:hypothetical protein